MLHDKLINILRDGKLSLTLSLTTLSVCVKEWDGCTDACGGGGEHSIVNVTQTAS